MRFLLIIALALATVNGQRVLRVIRRSAPTGITVVNVAVGQDASGGSATTIDAAATNHTSGNLLAVGCRYGSSASMSVSDTAGNTYTALTQYTDGTNQWQWFYAKNITGNASNVVTCTSTSAGYRAVAVIQISGVSTTTPLESGTDVGGSAASSATHTSPSFSTSTADTIIIFGVAGNSLGLTWSAGLIGGVSATAVVSTTGGVDPIAAVEYRIVSSTQAGITAAINLSPSAAAEYGVAVFK